MIFKDSLGFTHHLHEPLLKAGIPAPAEPPPGAFRALIDDLTALRDRRRRLAERVKNTPVNTRDQKAEKEAERVSRADHLPAIRPTPARPAKATAQPLRKSLESLARETQRMAAQVQRRTARALIDDLSAQAKAGRLGAIEAAKLDALRHANARALGLETTGVRR